MSSEKKKSFFGPALMIGGGLAAAVAAWWATKKSTATTSAIENAVRGDSSGEGVTLSSKGYPTVMIHGTGYWPYQTGLSATQLKMEGSKKDRKGRAIITLEQHLSDPVTYPYTTVAGDWTIWPDGQRVILSPWPDAIFRITDTGGHFFGPKKVFRVSGEEPLDIAVDSSKTFVPKSGITAQIIPGDNFAKGAAVATGSFKGQSVVVGEGFTNDDAEALSRAIESELSGRPEQEQLVAAWSIRNRAEDANTTIQHLLAPNGEYGAPQDSGGYASTRKTPSDKSRAIASKVLDASTDKDPSDGAIDFWVPSQQNKMYELGDVHRAAAKSGDMEKAQRYEKYAAYGTEDDVRLEQARNGLRILKVVGVIELLGKK